MPELLEGDDGEFGWRSVDPASRSASSGWRSLGSGAAVAVAQRTSTSWGRTRFHLPPEHLGPDVLLVCELAAELGQRLGFVVASERQEPRAEQGCRCRKD